VIAYARRHTNGRRFDTRHQPLEVQDRLRRGDPPAQLVARSVEEGVSVGLVQPEAHREAPVQQLEHLMLDVGEQGDVDVEDGMQDVAELPGTSALAGMVCWFRAFGHRDGRVEGMWAGPAAGFGRRPDTFCTK